MKTIKISMLILVFFSTAYPKNIIWDLGDVLLGVNKLGIAREIGISNFMSYLFIDWKSPSKIQAKTFALLRKIKNESQHELYDTYRLPDVFQELMEGKLTSNDVIQLALNKIDELVQLDRNSEYKYFCSDREITLIKNTILAMFTPSILAQNSYPLYDILEIVKECRLKIDAEGNQEHQLFILSNFADDAFDELYAQNHTHIIFEPFIKDNIIISGKIKAAKPNPAAFTYILEKFNLPPSDCIFIDDRKENVDAAKYLGMQGIHLATPDPKYLRNALHELEIL